MTDVAARCRVFHDLHQTGCFVMPNPWDIGSARFLAQLGFPALATTSAGFAWSLGRRDNGVSLTEALTLAINLLKVFTIYGHTHNGC